MNYEMNKAYRRYTLLLASSLFLWGCQSQPADNENERPSQERELDMLKLAIEYISNPNAADAAPENASTPTC